MVTTPESIFLKMSTRDQWNLKDPDKKDAWVVRIHSALQKAGVFKALQLGRPTLGALKAEHPKMGARAAQATLEALTAQYEELIGIAWEIFLPRLDLSDSWLANEVSRHMSSRNGQAIWDLVQKECDVSTGAKQDAIVSEWEAFKLPANLPPLELRSRLSHLFMLFSKHGAYSQNLDDVSPLIRKALRVLPSTGPFAGFAGTLRSLLLADRVMGLFDTWDAFVDVMLEHYAQAYAAAPQDQLQLAALADGGAPPLTSDELRSMCAVAPPSWVGTTSISTPTTASTRTASTLTAPQQRHSRRPPRPGPP